jgi:hypothetical protein
MGSGILFISVTPSFSKKDMSEPAPVVSLGHDERKIFGCGIKNHDETNGKRIPQKEEGGEKGEDPMGQFSSTGFDQKSFKIGPVTTAELVFWETHSSEERGSIGQIFFPFPDPENVTVPSPVSLPLPASTEPVRRIKVLRRNPDHDMNNAHVNHKPSNDVDDNCPKGGEMDESHALKSLFRSLYDSPLPGDVSHKENAKKRQPEQEHEENQGDLKQKRRQEPEISDSQEHPVNLQHVEAIQKGRPKQIRHIPENGGLNKMPCD